MSPVADLSTVCSQCGGIGPTVAQDATGNYCQHCVTKMEGWDLGRHEAALQLLDVALGMALESGSTPAQLFRHCAARLEQTDELQETVVHLGGGVLEGQR